MPYFTVKLRKYSVSFTLFSLTHLLFLRMRWQGRPRYVVATAVYPALHAILHGETQRHGVSFTLTHLLFLRMRWQGRPRYVAATAVARAWLDCMPPMVMTQSCWLATASASRNSSLRTYKQKAVGRFAAGAHNCFTAKKTLKCWLHAMP
jgi:hypothetical protein